MEGVGKRQWIAYCGLDCQPCKARLATVNDDEALCVKVARQWSELNGVEITPEMIRCTGCRVDGVKTPYCESQCPIRQCARERSMETCGSCARRDACEKLGAILQNNPDAAWNLSGFVLISLRERPELLARAAAWFHAKWGVPEETYRERMAEYLRGETEYGWYLCLAGKRIVGGLGIVENDFHVRRDLAPNVCAVYVEEDCRRQGIAGRLLNLAVAEMRAAGIAPLYLVTDSVGFYEHYGWEFLGMVPEAGQAGLTRMYMHR